MFSVNWLIGIALIAIYVRIIELFLSAYNRNTKAFLRVILSVPNWSDLRNSLLIDSIVNIITFLALSLYFVENGQNFYVIFSFSLIVSYGVYLGIKVISVSQVTNIPRSKHQPNLAGVLEDVSSTHEIIIESSDILHRLNEIFVHKKINHFKEISKIKIKTQRKILKKYRAPANARLIAAYDSTFFRTFNCGIVFTDLGIYWKNDSISTQPGKFSISYEDLVKSEISEENGYEVSIKCNGEEMIILPYVGDQFEPSRDLCVLLKIIKVCLTELHHENVESLIRRVEKQHKETIEREFEASI